jgi:acyl carrier protein
MTTCMSPIEDALIRYISTQLASSAPQLSPETDLTEVVDSTAVMELVVWMEDNYGFQVELDDITPEQFGTVARLAAFIESHRSK